MTELLFKQEVYAIIGAAIEVYNVLGSGFLEAVYQEALELELADRRVPFVAQKPLKIVYKGRQLTKEYLADMVCYDQIIVELKALDRLSSKEEAQVINYLKATGFRVGLLITLAALASWTGTDSSDDRCMTLIRVHSCDSWITTSGSDDERGSDYRCGADADRAAWRRSEGRAAG